MTEDDKAFCQDNLDSRNLLARIYDSFEPKRQPKSPTWRDDLINDNPLTIGEFRKGVTAILDALKNVNGSKYHRTVESDGQRVSYGADTLDELNVMIGEPVNQEPIIEFKPENMVFAPSPEELAKHKDDPYFKDYLKGCVVETITIGKQINDPQPHIREAKE